MVLYPALSNNCNCNCQFCCYRYNMTEHNTMPLDKYIELLDDCKGLSVNGQYVDAVRMDGNRELFVYRQWREAVAETFNRGFVILLFTNGALLDPEASEYILRHGLRGITFSISGITPETYYKFQGYSTKGGVEFAEKQLNTVLYNLKEFIRLKNEINPFCRVEVSCLLGADDMLEKKKSVEFFGDMGIDCFFSPSMLDIEKENCEKNTNRYKSAKSNCALPLEDAKAKQERYKNHHSPYAGWCYRVIVSTNGDLHTCCEIGGGEKITLGNVFEKPLSQIIKSKEWFDFFDALASRDFEKMHPICRDCLAVIG